MPLLAPCSACAAGLHSGGEDFPPVTAFECLQRTGGKFDAAFSYELLRGPSCPSRATGDSHSRPGITPGTPEHGQNFTSSRLRLVTALHGGTAAGKLSQRRRLPLRSCHFTLITHKLHFHASFASLPHHPPFQPLIKILLRRFPQQSSFKMHFP